MYSLLQKQMAAMAFNAYRLTDENQINLGPQGWTKLTGASRSNRGNGFDATAYRVNDGRIVIALRGTDGGAFNMAAVANGQFPDDATDMQRVFLGGSSGARAICTARCATHRIQRDQLRMHALADFHAMRE
jgi:hypothetical protein